jgi:hypothetical protein
MILLKRLLYGLILIVILQGCDTDGDYDCMQEYDVIRREYIAEVLHLEAMNSPDAPALRKEMQDKLDALNCF